MRGLKQLPADAFPKLSGSVTFHEASLDRVSRRLAFKEETFVWGETQVFETLQPCVTGAATMGDGSWRYTPNFGCADRRETEPRPSFD